MARGVLLSPVKASQYAAPDLLLSVHVDDFGQEAIGTASSVVDSLVKGGIAFAYEATARKLSISDRKSVVRERVLVAV